MSAEIVGAWLMAFGCAAALAIRQRDLGELLVPAVAYTVFGVFQLLVVVRYRSQVMAGDPALWTYLTVLTAIVLTGGYGWWAAQRTAAIDPVPPETADVIEIEPEPANLARLPRTVGSID